MRLVQLGWVCALLAAGCGGKGVSAVDAGGLGDTGPAVDAGAVGDAGAADAAAVDVPSADVSSADVPSADVPAQPVASPTWAEHVAPILYNTCVGCHRAGEIGPFPLVSYEDARNVAPLMRRVTAERSMPPTVVNATGACQNYRSDVRRLTDAEIATIGRWVEQGTPQGDPRRAPPLPPSPSGLTEADVRLDIGTTYMPNASRTDDYRCFIADPGITEDRYVTAFEVIPGEPRVVHHVIVYSLPNATAQQAAERQDAQDTTPGYECFGGPGVDGSMPLAIWAPGGVVTRFPRNTGLLANAGRKVVIQVHYNLAGGSLPDRTRVNLLTARAVTAQGFLVPYRPDRVELPPRMTEAVASDVLDLGNLQGLPQVFVYGVAPHMHTLGRTLRVDVLRNDERHCLVDVPRWDFHWQQIAFYDQPFTVRRGDRVSIRCSYDTTSRSAVTRWGEGTQDEMCLNYFYITPFRAPN
ncbi:MAG: hypothetical protein JNK72_10630 [Myxococcales bacterium]|nr:hypothetical protein [Myxococcales bacterium]